MKEERNGVSAVELCSVSKRFGSRVILDKIDLAVARGEIVVLVGPSGSGKSTLLKVISGIESPDHGRVLLAGQDCTSLPPFRRAVHTVFQNYALFPHLDVAGNVAFPLAVAGIPRNERQRLVAEALEWVKLERHSHRRVDKLSGGERQRVALARALVDSPACVLLDEPLSALDPHLRAETLELLRGIQERLKTTFLFITHDREEAMRIGHRIGVLSGGKLEQVGEPEDVYRQPRTAFVASFLGKINWLRGELVAHSAAKIIIAGQALSVVCSHNGSSPPLGPVLVGVRPEDVEINGSGCLPATVIGRHFLGDSLVVRLRLADGTIVLADTRATLAAAIGDSVQVGWPADAAHLFAAEEVAP